MKSLVWTLVLILLAAPICLAQDDPMPIFGARWERTIRKALPSEGRTVSPARALLPDDKYYARKARESRTDNPMDPNKDSMDARSASIDRAMDEARSAQAENTAGFQYTTSIKNETGKTVNIIYWEYRFTEIARPENVTRRLFLCGVDLKDGASRDLSAFSLLGPSDVIDEKSLGATETKIFNETVEIDRIEFSDGTILQRLGWKFDDVRKAVERATSTPWGREVCRALQ